MTNFDTARDALETSLNSAGSAMAEHEKWQQSLEAQINKLKASWQSLSQAFLKSDFLKGALDAIIGLVDGLTKLIDTFGTLPALLGTVAAGMSLFKNKGLFTFDKDAKSIQLLGNGLTDLKGKYTQIQTAISRYNSLSSKSASFQEKYNKAMAGSSTSMGKYLSGLKGAKATFGGYIGSLVGATIKTIALEAATMALNAALTMGISFAIQLVVEAFDKLIVTSDELAEKVDELVSKFQEEHKALKDMKGDLDTTNESSMISKYEKLSKGVDNLGRNVSLTAEEYSEYQSIVNSIAEQIPSVVAGYDEQGNALLTCKGNVEALTEAYEKLIHTQNQEILTNTSDIEKDFANKVKDADGNTLWGKFREWNTNLPHWAKTLVNLSSVGAIATSVDDIADLTVGNKMTAGTAQALKELLNEDKDNIGNIVKAYDKQTLSEIKTALENAGVEVGSWGSLESNVSKALEKTLKDEPAKVKGVVDNFYGNLEETIANQKIIATAKLSEAFDVSSVISGLNYGNISEELQNIAYQTVNSFDYDFLSKLSKSGKSVEQWTTEMLDQLNALSEIDNKQIETGFELQTKFNGGDISYGQYISQLQETVDFIDKDLKVPEEVKNQIKLSLNSEDVLADYNALVHDLKEIGFDDTSINDFLNSLSAEEFSAAMKIIPDLDTGATINEIQALIDEQLATEFKFDIAIQTEGIEAFNTALTESRSAAGLTSESITALKARYEDLDGFNAAALFEKTANGIHLNSEELSRLEEQYISTNKLDIENNLNKLVTKYNDLTEEIKGCTDAQEKENLQLQADAYKDKIDELSTLASQYDGLTSAFAKWQTALEGAEEGDNYDSLYENLEGIKELYDAGLVGTDKFKTAVQLMTSKDLSGADIDEIVNAYKKGYPKMQRYFTEGQKGCKNFLNDVRNLNSEWAHLNKDGSWDINFNAEEVAKELGVSVDFVLQIAKKLKDYGFEVNLEDSSVDNLKTKIEQTEAKLKELGQAPVDINVDIEANSENLSKIDSEIEKAKSKIQEINNSSVDPKVKTAQLEDARAKLETLIDKKQEVSQPAFMNLNTSQVNASLVDALGKVQDYQNAINEVNKLSELKEAGITIDDTQLQTAKEKVDECAKAIQGLDGDVKLSIGLEEDGSIESIKKSFEDGKVKIDTNTDPALTKVEQLAENVERIEDKNVTINVTVNGLDQIKELNKQIDLATDIQGDIDELSNYVESAKTLSGLDDNIASYVTANVKGNVTETPEFKINNLKVFADSVKDLKDTGSFTSNVKADVKGNVVETPEYKLNNLKVFTDNAKDLDDIGSTKSEVTAEIKGNVIDEFEYKINNLKVFSDNAKDLHKIGDVEAKVKANVEGNVIDEFEYKLNNLKVFTDNAKDIGKIGNVESNVKATVNTGEDGDVVDTFEYKLNNLGEFAERAKELQGLDNVDLSVNATVNTGDDGDVVDTFEYKLNNLSEFAKHVEKLQGLDNVDINVKATVNTGEDGDVIDEFEYKLDNLSEFASHVKDLQGLQSVDVEVKASVNTGDDGDVVDTFEYKLDNLGEFATHVKELQGLESVDISVTAKVNTGESGDVVDTFEYQLNNLETFAEGVKALQGVEDVSVTVSAKVNTGEDGDAIDEFEYKLNNLETFAKGARALQGLENVDLSVSAKINTGGEGENATDTFEYKLNNLELFADAVQKLQGLEDIDLSVKATVNGGESDSVIDEFEYKLNNLGEFAKHVKALQGLENVNISVKATVDGDVTETAEYKLDNLGEFKKHAEALQNVESKKISITANIYGNVPEYTEGYLDDLQVFAKGAKALQNVASKTINITANIYGNVPTYSEGYLDDLQVFAKGANALQNTASKTVNIEANANGNAISGKGASGRISRLTEFKSLVNGMSNKTVTVSVAAKVDSENVNKAIQLLKDVSASGVFKNYSATVQVGAKIATIDDTTVKNYKAPPKDGKVRYSVDPESSVYTWTAPNKNGVVNYSAEVEALTKAQKHKRGTITYDVKLSGFPVVNGTANVNGTAFANGTSGKAYRQGDWGVKQTTTALTGELGQELVVYGNRFWTVGDNGAEFATIPKGAIVFNHKQTAELFANGKVTSGGGRGRALVEGTAFNNVGAKGKFYNSSTGESYGSTSDSSSDSSKDFEEVYDWIETILDRVERSIDKFDQQANNIYKSWSSRNTALQNQISEVNKEIGLQQQAKSKYMAAANGVGLSESWAKKVRNGEIDIDTIKDETLAEKIKSYQDYYNKVLDCEDAIRELQETEASLYAQRFENIQTQYDGILRGYEHTESMLNEYISQAEAQGHLVSEKYYNALINNEKQNISALKQEQDALIKARDEAVTSGKIAKNSEEWVSMSNDIDEVTQSIEESTTALIEYNNAIRDIEWEKFDLIQERISDITSESEFLIELMSNKDLFDDNGKLTEQGAATMGLHALNYNTSMYQSDDYGKEIANLDKQIAKDPYDQELINRRRELVELQRESILAAEDEKQAIKDLVQDGIDKELDALQERIDLHNEELDSMKDLYDYQKNVMEQTEEIASLRKQLSAYSEDTSEEAQKKVQELKISLEDAQKELAETEFDRLIQNTSILLDNLYTEYETILNSRLDNIDFLLQQVIDGINIAAGEGGTLTNALGAEGAIAMAIVNAVGENGTIKGILNTELGAVGTTLSNAMNSIWSVGEGNAKSVLTMYGNNFQTQQTTTNQTLSGIKTSVDKMADASDKDAQKKVEAPKTQPSTQANPTQNTTPTPTPSSSQTSGGDGKPAVGDKVKFISGKYYYDSEGKSPAGAKNLGKQVYITKINTASWATHPYHISTGKTLGSGDLGWLKKEQISGFATGKKKISDNEYAWTQEKGQEFIVRPSDGAILTPVAKGDSVLNATASGNIWNMANNPTEFIKDNLKLDTANVPNGANVQSNYTQHFDKVVFNMPNVKNYGELISEMQRDPKFERLIHAMTVDQIAGKSKLAKNKAIR